MTNRTVFADAPHHIGGPWSAAEDATLRKMHGEVPLKDIQEKLNRSAGAVRGRITRLGLRKQFSWTETLVSEIRDLYAAAGSDDCLSLKAFCQMHGVSAASVSRKARQMGLATSFSRKKVDVRKPTRKHATIAESRAATAAGVRAAIARSGHPRGMLGKKHSAETRSVLSKIMEDRWVGMPEDAKQGVLDRLAGRRPESVKRGSWNAQWKEIGGKRNFYRSLWEANYACYLEWLKISGQIVDWQHEPETFWFEKIKRGVRSYKPDFRVWENDGTSALHEVKGWMDSRSRTTIARMRKYYPQEKLIVIDTQQYKAIRRKAMSLVPGWQDSPRDRRT